MRAFRCLFLEKISHPAGKTFHGRKPNHAARLLCDCNRIGRIDAEERATTRQEGVHSLHSAKIVISQTLITDGVVIHSKIFDLPAS